MSLNSGSIQFQILQKSRVEIDADKARCGPCQHLFPLYYLRQIQVGLTSVAYLKWFVKCLNGYPSMIG